MGDFDFKLDLSSFGAPGFSLRERSDFSGHKNGRVDPHLNTEVMRQNPDGSQSKVVRDLTNTQFPGFNGMQQKPKF